jgi:hypothetical protein
MTQDVGDQAPAYPVIVLRRPFEQPEDYRLI